MISKKLRHETELDYQLRTYKERWPEDYWKSNNFDDDNKRLDAQGRHRSEWCYSPYDGRAESPNEKTRDTWEILLDRYSGLLK